MAADVKRNTVSDAGETQERLAYIRQMLLELHAAAHREGAEMLCYLIEMAYIEAGDIQSGRRQLSVRHHERNPPSGMSV